MTEAMEASTSFATKPEILVDSETAEGANAMDDAAPAAESGKENDAAAAKATNPFDDPIQRTRCLVQYIRIRKKRAENELAKRNALRKQKKDAQATLQNARDSMRASEEEVRRCDARMEELTRMRQELVLSQKSLAVKEAERKRQIKAAAEETRRAEEQRIQAAAQQAALSQLLGLDTLLLQQQQQQQQQQLKNAQLLSAFNAANAVNNRVAQLAFPSASPSAPGTSSSVQGTSSPAPSAAVGVPHQQQNLFAQFQQQAASQLAGGIAAPASDATALQQQLQQQAATLNFLRQYGGIAGLSALTVPQTQQQQQQAADASPVRAASTQQQQQQQLDQQQQNLRATASNSPALSLLQQQQQRRQPPPPQQQQQGATNVPPAAATSALSTADALSAAMAANGIPQDVIYQALLANLSAANKPS